MSEHKNPLSRERVFTVCDDQVTVKATMEDFFGALMQDHPTREECLQMLSEIIDEHVYLNVRKELMDIIREYI